MVCVETNVCLPQPLKDVNKIYSQASILFRLERKGREGEGKEREGREGEGKEKEGREGKEREGREGEGKEKDGREGRLY